MNKGKLALSYYLIGAIPGFSSALIISKGYLACGTIYFAGVTAGMFIIAKIVEYLERGDRQ